MPERRQVAYAKRTRWLSVKTFYHDGTTHGIFEPGVSARLAAQVPKSMVDLTRFYGVFGPNVAQPSLESC